VNWKAPALDTVLSKFSEDEVEFILEYGRPFSPDVPMGPGRRWTMNEQQIETSSPT
jgi:hypothetical protein